MQWNLQRAFDSVPYSFIWLALLQMEVQLELVDFLVNMMECNIMTVASPLHLLHDAAFQTGASNWAGRPSFSSYMDCCVWYTSLHATFNFYYSGCHVCSRYGNKSITGARYCVRRWFGKNLLFSLSQQQIKVDLVCTLCACTGIQVTLTKVRSVAINWRKYIS